MSSESTLAFEAGQLVLLLHDGAITPAEVMVTGMDTLEDGAITVRFSDREGLELIGDVEADTLATHLIVDDEEDTD